MGLQNIDIGAVLRRLADKRIEDAMGEGKFDNLAGAGQPLDLEPLPPDENARLAWWALRILKNSDYTPEEVVWRKAIDHLKARLNAATKESQVPPLVRQVNELVLKLNTLGTNALKSGVAPLDEAEELERFWARTAP